MTNLEKLCTDSAGVRKMLLDLALDIDCAHCPAYEFCAGIEGELECPEAMEQWLEMEVEPDSIVATEPEVRTVEIGGQLFRMVQTHPFKPEGGGGGILYPLGSGGGEGH